jgi:Tfp pilus assembly protein PilO
MNLFAQRQFSERQQVVAIILAVTVILGVLWYFLLLPMNRQRKGLEQDIDTMASELAQKNYLLGEDALQRKLDIEINRCTALEKEWQDTVDNLGALAPHDDATTSSVAHIDFKVMLFTVRQRLFQKSRTLGISLPKDLGVDETIVSNEDAVQRMLQLKVVEKLVDLALDLKIKTVRGLCPLPPIAHRVGANQIEYFREYPLELDLYGTQDNLYELLDTVMESGHVFVLRGLRVEPTGQSRTDLLNIKAVMSALVFLKNPGDLAGAPLKTRKDRPRRPLGH